MNHPGGPNERLPYWGKCKEMSFAELRKFIDDTLDKLSDPSIPESDALPRSQEELLALCDMLKAKADALKDRTPMPEYPIYEGPAHPGPFIPSDELEALYCEYRRAEKRVDDALRDGASENYLEFIERELEEVEREIAHIEGREKQDYKRQLREYEKAREPFLRRERLRREEVARTGNKREAEATRERAVERIRQKVKHAVDSQRASGPQPTGHVPFEILPPGEATDERVRGYYDGLRREGKLREFDQRRLDKVLALPWDNWRPGTAGMEGYSIFTFAHTEKVLLECPIYANAIYVLDSGEERLLKMNKQQLRASGEAKVIIHTGDWYRRVHKELGLPMPLDSETPDEG
jgi:hypothetical protein